MLSRIAHKVRRGQGPFWGGAKRAATAVLQFHLPADGVLKPLFGALYWLHVLARETVAWLLRVLWYEPLFRSQCFRCGPRLQMEKLPYIAGRGRITVGGGVRLSGKIDISFSGILDQQPELVIGDGTFIGDECSFNIAKSLCIGRHCLLALGVRIYDLDGHPLDAARRRAGEPTPPEAVRPVQFGDDVWIGTRAIILSGVTIGSRSVVGAGAVVTRDVPADTIVAGNPARVVKSLLPADYRDSQPLEFEKSAEGMQAVVGGRAHG